MKSCLSVVVCVLILFGCTSVNSNGAPSVPVGAAHFQAHRGGLEEVPENTLAAFRRAWSIEGAVPEVDIRTSKDGVLICLHDSTLERTTDAPNPIKSVDVGQLTADEIRRWDAGKRFDARYEGERVPLLTELFDEMRGRSERQLYLDMKAADPGRLLTLIDEYGLRDQVIFVHGDQDTCFELSKLYPGARTMTWLSGSPREIERKFELAAQSDFKGLSQLQFHLRARRTRPEIIYGLETEFLEYALRTTKEAGVDLQVRPMPFDAKALRVLLDLGICWYVADAPGKFADAIQAARAIP